MKCKHCKNKLKILEILFLMNECDYCADARTKMYFINQNLKKQKIEIKRNIEVKKRFKYFKLKGDEK